MATNSTSWWPWVQPPAPVALERIPLPPEPLPPVQVRYADMEACCVKHALKSLPEHADVIACPDCGANMFWCRKAWCSKAETMRQAAHW